MSTYYKQYAQGKNPAEMSSGIVNAIYGGIIKQSDLPLLIKDLEENHKLNRATVDIIPKSEWDENYLQLLRNEVIVGAFSEQYLLYLAEVTEHVHASKDNAQCGEKYRGLSPVAITIGITLCIAAVIVIVALIIL